jgi:CRP-like cAMP-binding protein
MFESFLNYLGNYVNLTQEEETVLTSFLLFKKYKKRQYFLMEGDVCRYQAYVLKGCFRSYYIDKEGKEVNLMFSTENWWIGDLASYIVKDPSKLNIEALEDCEIFAIEKQHMDLLFQKIPKIERFFRILFQNALISSQNRIINNLTLTAKDNYLSFVNKYPDFEQRIPQYHIASYLGITPEFLSQIRKQLTTRS